MFTRRRKTWLAALGLVVACTATAEAQMAWSYRLGNDPYKYVDDAPPRAYTRMAPTPSAYFRTPTNPDDQIGPPTPPDQVERLAGALNQHLKMNYKHDIPEYNRRYVHFRAAMDEWDKSPKGIPEQVQITAFLKTSIKYSMPGSHDFLPPLPKVNPINLLNESSYARGVEDPFKDDPVQAAPM